MHTTVNGGSARGTLAWAVFWVLCSLALASNSAAEEAEERRWDDRWVPSFAITSGVTWFEDSASVSSRDVVADEPLRPSAQGQEDHVTPFVGFNLELLTPAVEPGEPRLFANFEFMGNIGVALDVAKEGNPKQIQAPEGNFPPPGCPLGFGCYEEALVNGVGSKTTAQLRVPSYAAGFGVSFPFEVAGRTIHVKPSVGWYRYAVKVDGKVLRQIKPLRDLPQSRDVELKADKNQSFNAIGPGLEIELDAGRQGPIEPSIFFDAHGYRVLGDRRVKLSDRQNISGCTPDDPILCGILFPEDGEYTADWNWKAKPWIYRFGIGIRFRWVGF